jgi:Cys-tRNA(Pro)/Cys-tRNA(Cys) deacylase
MSSRGTRATEVVRRAGMDFEVHAYEHGARTTLRSGGRGYALEAVAALGLDPARVLKTIVVAVDGHLALAVVPADSEVDLKAVAAALAGRRAVLAEAAEAERATGYILGGISPLGTRRLLPTLIDAGAAGHPTVFVSAGQRGLEIELAPGDLARLTGGRFAAVARRG